MSALSRGATAAVLFALWLSPALASATVGKLRPPDAPREPERPPPAPATPALSYEGRVPVVDKPPDCLRDGSCRGVRFRRPEDCADAPRYWRNRRMRRCARERWRTIYVDTSGRVIQATPPGPFQPNKGGPRGRAQLEVWDLLLQWRRCEAEDDPLLGGDPEVLKRHPDPDLGVCTLYRPDIPTPADLPSRLGLSRLRQLHPYVADAARELVHRAHAAGLTLRILSGYRPYRGRKKVSWHAWSVSFDVNLTRYRSMADAKRRFSEDRDDWATIGRLCRELGLWWGGIFDSYDVFHIEWHPGFKGRLKPDELKRFLAKAGRRGEDYEKTWILFEPPPARRR